MEKFSARRGKISWALIILLSLLPALIYFIDTSNINKKPYLLFPVISPLIIFLWLFLDTSYRIEKNWLYYRSGFNRGKINIQSIRRIKTNSSLWIGNKPALARNGLIIYYNKYEELYISPKEEDKMLQCFININPKIEVSG